MEEQLNHPRLDLHAFSEKVQSMRAEIGRYVVGQEEAVTHLLAAIIADGHVLVEGVPGIAKTLLAKVLSRLWMPVSGAFSLRPTSCQVMCLAPMSST